MKSSTYAQCLGSFGTSDDTAQFLLFMPDNKYRLLELDFEDGETNVSIIDSLDQIPGIGNFDNSKKSLYGVLG